MDTINEMPNIEQIDYLKKTIGRTLKAIALPDSKIDQPFFTFFQGQAILETEMGLFAIGRGDVGYDTYFRGMSEDVYRIFAGPIANENEFLDPSIYRPNSYLRFEYDEEIADIILIFDSGQSFDYYEKAIEFTILIGIAIKTNKDMHIFYGDTPVDCFLQLRKGKESLPNEEDFSFTWNNLMVDGSKIEAARHCLSLKTNQDSVLFSGTFERKD